MSTSHMPAMGSARHRTLDGLLPELYPIVISHLPLHATPPTLLALALANKSYHKAVIPHLYRQVILKDEELAVAVLLRLLEGDDQVGGAWEGIGSAVHGLHIYSDLSPATRRGETPGDVVSLLARLVASRRVPNLHSLSVHFQSGWYCDPVDWSPVRGYGVLGKEFWADLRNACPELKEVTLGMVGDREDEEWLEESGIYELQGLTSLQVSFRLWCPSIDALTTLFNNITSPSLASSLQTLTLHNNIPTNDWITTSEILKCTFPRLEHINLQHFTRGNVGESMDFWKRHPGLQTIEIMLGGGGVGWYEGDSTPGGEADDGAWFSADVPADAGGWAAFLPRLRYLKTTYRDTRALAPLLPRLRGLYITDSTNAQVPYLLRAVLPAGLGELRSLGMHAKASAWRENEGLEGALWYEDHEYAVADAHNGDGSKQGPFKQEAVKKGNRLTQNRGYVDSVRKAAPNLEEIGLYNLLYPYEHIIPALTEFTSLKRVFFTGMKDPELHREFALALGRASKTVESVTEVIDRSGPNPAFRVLRKDKEGNGLAEIKKVTAFGMIVGHEADPFPSEL